MSAKTKAQLIAEIEALQKRLTGPQTIEAETHPKNGASKEQAHVLGERVKELDCLYGISQLVETPSISLMDILQGSADLLPPAWQYPQITCARIMLNDQEYKTGNFRETKWKLAREIKVENKDAGSVEVFYLQKQPKDYEGPFLKEERALIDVIAERLGRIIQRVGTQEEVEHLTLVLRAIRNVNQLIIREKNRDVLIQEICDNLTETRGYSTAWIMLLDESSKYLDSAESGLGKGFTPLLKELKQGKFPACVKQALSQPGLTDITDPSSTCADCPIMEKYSDKGRMTIKLEHAEKVYGTLSVSFGVDITVDEEELSLFEEVAGDIAFALYSIKTEQERKQAQERAQKYLDIAEVIIVALNKEGEITLINRKGNRILGYGEDELLGLNWFDTCLPLQTRKNIKESFYELMAGGAGLGDHFEQIILTKSGEERIIDWHSTPLWEWVDEEKHRIGSLSSGEDITERVQREKLLLQQRNNLNSLLEISQNISATPDINNILKLILKNAAQLTGLDSGAIYLLKGEILHLEVALPSLPPQFPEKLRDAPLNDHPHIQESISTGSPVILPDTAATTLTSAERAVSDIRGLRSILYLPLLIEKEAVGVLILGTVGKTRSFSTDEIDMYRTMSSQTALIIKNARLLEGERISANKLKKQVAELEKISKELRQRTEDMSVINAINTAANRGEELQEIFRIFSGKTREIFSDSGATVYLLSKDKKKFIMQDSYLHPAIEKQIKNLIGIKIPKIELVLEPGSLYQQTLLDRKPRLIYDPVEIQAVLNEFVSAAPLSGKVRAGIKKLVPKIQKILKMQSVVIIPLLTAGKAIGVLDISNTGMFTKSDIERLKAITEQVTSAIVRVQSEEKLYQSEGQYRSVVEDSPGVIGRFLPNGTVTFANRGYCKFIGKEYDELIGTNITSTILEEDRESVMTNLASITEESPVRIFENKVIRHDGEIRWMRWTNRALFDNKGQLTSIQAFGQDITGIMEAERALSLEQEKAQKYLDVAGVALVALNKKGEITLVNNKGNQILGYQEDELIGVNWFDTCLPERNRKEVRGVFRKLMAGDIEPVEFYENMVLTRSGKEKIIAWHNTVLWDEKGNNIGILSSGEDITERKRAERLLNALNQAAVAMGTAQTQQEIFDSVSEELKQLDISCMLFPLDETQSRLITKYVNLESTALTMIEKLLGVKHKDFSFPVDAVDMSRKVVREKKTQFVEKPEQVVEQVLPKLPKKILAQLIKTPRISKYISAPLIAEDQSIGMFLIQSDKLTREDIPAATAFAHQLAGAWNKTKLVQGLRETVEGAIHTIAATVEARDPYTAGHQTRVADLAAAIATEMDLASEQVEGIKMAGVIHDLGKVQVPAEILSKPGKISELEYKIIQTHSQVGFDLLKEIEFPWPIAEMVHQHHEMIDGSGYPQGLKGEEILLEARILAVADIVEAMSSHRPYRPALGIEKALAQIKQDKGTLFDPDVVDACLKIFKEGYKLVDN